MTNYETRQNEIQELITNNEQTKVLNITLISLIKTHFKL